MEEILASIRRIIADDQALPISQRDAAPARPAQTPSPVAPAAPKPADSGDNDFDAWLSETAGRGPKDAAKPAEVPPPRLQAVPSTPAPVAPAAAMPTATPHRPANDWDEDARSEDEADDSGGADYQTFDAMEPRLSVVEAEGDDPAASDDDLERPVAAQTLEHPAEGLLSQHASKAVSSSLQTLAQSVMLQNAGLVEQSVRDMLRPMLKQWLDDNLPTMVERLVRAEIERVARGGP
ncbi:MAG: PopZ family protein [Beijerinckiaceae bacterium]